MSCSLAAALALILLAAPPKTATAAEVVEKLARWTPPKDFPRDAANPFAKQVAGLGAAAVPALLAALDNQAQAYRDQQTAFVWLLGEIGDPRAFDRLLALFEAEKGAGARMRTGVSLGASLDPTNVSKLFARLEHLAPAIAVALLVDVTGQDLEDVAKFKAWLSVPANLEATVKSCKQRSIPQHG